MLSIAASSFYCILIRIKWPETENHVLMEETTRYITNQLIMRQEGLTDDDLLEYDNSLNGFNEWMLEHLQQFFINYFYEYNSKPYQSYTLMAIENLFAFAEDASVKLAAEMLLDLLTSVFAIQSNGLRRIVPFRRQDEYEKESKITRKDGESSRMALLAGNYEYLRADDHPVTRLSASYGGYGGEKFNDKDFLPDYPLLSDLEICADDRLFGLRYIYRDGMGGIDIVHGSCKDGKSSSIKLDWEEYLIQMVVHTGVYENTVRVFYVEFSTSKGQVLAGGTKTSEIHVVNAERYDNTMDSISFHISGFRGRSGKEIDELGAILTPIEYMYDDKNQRPYSEKKLLAAIVSKYRIPDMVLDIIIRKDNNSYFQKLRHDGVEMYSSSKNYIINAGGIYERTFLFGATEQHGWALPTTIMPTKDPRSDYDNWIRILGHKDRTKRFNHCVHQNFGCGTNVIIPHTIPRACITKYGDNWNFIDFTSPVCSLDLGFYVAIYIKDCDSIKCNASGRNYGFFEVREADELPFADFIQIIIENNDQHIYRSKSTNSYVKSDGQIIEFEVLQTEKWVWSIISIDGVPQDTNMKEWPFADGPIMNSKRDGKVIVENPFLGKRMILDMSDFLNPKRSFQDI